MIQGILQINILGQILVDLKKGMRWKHLWTYFVPHWNEHPTGMSDLDGRKPTSLALRIEGALWEEGFGEYLVGVVGFNKIFYSIEAFQVLKKGRGVWNFQLWKKNPCLSDIFMTLSSILPKMSSFKKACVWCPTVSFCPGFDPQDFDRLNGD